MDKFAPPLLESNYYHVYNRANSSQRLFYKEENYEYFLFKFSQYLTGFAELYSFCLLPNHFHLLIKVEKEVRDLTGCKNLSGLNKANKSITQAFSNLFNSFSKSINKQENTYGNLFQRPFKRIAINNNEYLLKVVYYIHQNPVHHGICKEIDKYKWSSYYFITNEIGSIKISPEVLDWFGGLREFVDLHKSMIINYKENFVIE